MNFEAFMEIKHTISASFVKEDMPQITQIDKFKYLLNIFLNSLINSNNNIIKLKSYLENFSQVE